METTSIPELGQEEAAAQQGVGTGRVGIGISLLFVGTIGIALWLYFLLSLRESGQEITPWHFLAFFLPLAIALVGLCFLIYSTYLMTKVRKERMEHIE